MSVQSVTRFIPALACIAIFFWLSSIPSEVLMHNFDPVRIQAYRVLAKILGKEVSVNWLKVGHFVGYAILGAALFYGFGSFVRRPWPWAMSVAVLFAFADEIHQISTPGRSAGWQDIVLDIIAAGLAILLVSYIRSIRKKAHPTTYFVE